MILKRRQMKSGSALFGFFAANDAELSVYLNSLPTSERETISATLDAALQAPSEEFFTNRLEELFRAYFQAPEGSEVEMRLRAITRMLGLVLRDRYRRDPAAFWERVWTETGVGQEQPQVEPDIFDSAREQLKMILRETDLSDDWIGRAEAAHWAADMLSFDLIESDSDDALCNELRRIRGENDLVAATQAVCGLAWNFAFDGSIFGIANENDDHWLQMVSRGLAPKQDLAPPHLQPDDLAALRDKFITLTRGGEASPYYVSLARLALGHLRIHQDDVLLVSMHLAQTSTTLKRRLSEAAP